MHVLPSRVLCIRQRLCEGSWYRYIRSVEFLVFGLHFSPFSHKTTIDDLWAYFKQPVFECTDKYIPKSEVHYQKESVDHTWIGWIGRRIKRLRSTKPLTEGTPEVLVCMRKTLREKVRNADNCQTEAMQTILVEAPGKYWRRLSPRKHGVTVLWKTISSSPTSTSWRTILSTFLALCSPKTMAYIQVLLLSKICRQ